MKVLLVATVQSHICQFHRPLVELLHEHGCEVHVAARDNLAEKNGLSLDFVDKIINIPFSRSPISKSNITAYRQLKKLIENENYDIIHCNTPTGGVVSRLAGNKARKRGCKIFYTAHGFHFYRGAPRKNWLIYYPIEKVLSKKCDKLITIVSEDYELARKKFKTTVCRIHGVGVDPNRYHPVSIEEKNTTKTEMGFLPDDKIILSVGELLPNKNHELSIKAMRLVVDKYSDAKLLIAGNGPDLDWLLTVVDQLNLNNNVVFLGYVLNLQEYQRVADVLVASSIREGLPLNVIEALMSGTPVVATTNRGHRELIRSGENGFLVEQHAHEEIAKRVLELLDNSKLRNDLAANAVLTSQTYSFEVVKQELKNIYEL